MTKSKTTHKAHAFSGAAALITAALLTAILFTACPNTAGGGNSGAGGGGGTVPPAPGTYAQVPYGELETYLANTASSEKLNYIEVTGEIPVADFKGDNSNPGALGQKLQAHSGKKVALKIATYPAGLTDMSWCFYGCTGLTTAPAFPAGVKNMKGCFKSCTSLTTVPNIPAGVTDIPYCFYGCTGLTTAPAIPAGVTDMLSCFAACTSLTTVPDIPASVKVMGYCFKDCTNLTGVTLKCKYNPAQIYANPAFKNAFQGCTALQNGSIKVPAEQLTIYKANADAMGTAEEKFAAIP